jgi:hypothetical protein
MPGIADEIEGAMQQAPHPALHAILLMARHADGRQARAWDQDDRLGQSAVLFR